MENNKSSLTDSITLLIFTCEGRELLLQKTYNSFLAACNYKFNRIILAIDGVIDTAIIAQINPDLVIYNYKRKGYVNSIVNALKHVSTSYFFWLEDDWRFSTEIDVNGLLKLMSDNEDWAEIVLSKYGPLPAEFKLHLLKGNLYQTTFGFSANPCMCSSKYLKTGFEQLANAHKGDKLGEDGFENFLSKAFEKENIKCVIIDPVDHFPISHEGYLESTPRNWHMTNSLNSKTEKYLLTIPEPPLWRRLLMMAKLSVTFFKLSFRQLVNNEVYEFCFRVVAGLKSINKRD